MWGTEAKWVGLPNRPWLPSFLARVSWSCSRTRSLQNLHPAMSGAATSAGASKFQQFMNHPAGQLAPVFGGES